MKIRNKGFSLVELIIVIAIMAVLIAVLAPQFIKYVERSRIQKDESAASEVLRAAQIALSEEDVYDALVAEGGTVSLTVADEGSPTCTVTELQTSVRDVVPGPIDFTSKKHNGQTYTVQIVTTTDPITVTGDPAAAGSWS
ncbi:MAG: prepilin-type N-terminal cleavage/methylation domain-containing protein [Oscillospiraceae bacterium]|jgi:type IV pilus assembly protein PilA|nr:prepilin-type N-terminal cleavage/methylation domain-containing protein [Oscillospiraceae bacterium]